jgi:hypothetical protein
VSREKIYRLAEILYNNDRVMFSTSFYSLIRKFSSYFTVMFVFVDSVNFLSNTHYCKT